MQDEILRVIDEASAWLGIDGVVSIAPGDQGGRPCIVVGCSRPVAEMVGRVPATFRGYPVVLEEWGDISAQNAE